MADVWADVDRQVNNYVNKNRNSNPQIKNLTTLNLRSEAEALMECIKKYTQSQTVLGSIEIQLGNNPLELIITFDPAKATLRSEFNDPTSPIYQGGYDADAYLPLLRNEGYMIKPQRQRWRNYFGRGASGQAEHFIEKGIADYNKSNKGKLNITVKKTFTIGYSSYNSFIDETDEY